MSMFSLNLPVVFLDKTWFPATEPSLTAIDFSGLAFSEPQTVTDIPPIMIRNFFGAALATRISIHGVAT